MSRATGDLDAGILWRVLRQQGIDVLQLLADQLLSEALERPRRKKDLADLLRDQSNPREVLAALCELASRRKQEEPADSKRIWAFQHLDWTVGPLGTHRSRQRRRAKQAIDMVDMLNEVLEKSALPAFARFVCSGADGAELMRILKKTIPAKAQSAAYLQLALLGNDDELAEALRQAVKASPNRKLCMSPSTAQITYSESYWNADLPWLVTKWGPLIPSPPRGGEPDVLSNCREGDAVSSLAGMLVLLKRGRVLDAAVKSFHGPDDLSKAKELVLTTGPMQIIRRWFSEYDLWGLLDGWGLVLPPPDDVSREELESLLLQLIGLRYVPKPRGLYSLNRALNERSWSSNTDSFRVLLEFESAYEGVLVAYVGALFDDSDFPLGRELRGTKGERILIEEGLVATSEGGKKRLSIDQMAFGDKVRTFNAIIGRARCNESVTSDLEELGLTAEQLTPIVGHEVQQVVSLRNDLAHGRNPSGEEVRAAVSAALDAMLGGRSEKWVESPVPIKVRILEATTDLYGWTRYKLEDELGREILCHYMGWLEPDTAFYMFGRTNPAVVEPLLIPV